MGLHVEIYRIDAPGRDCTLNGISSTAKGLCLVNVSGPFVPDAAYPAAMLVRGNLPGTLKIVPAVPEGNDGWRDLSGTMMGGNFGATPDSRFSQACESLLGHRFYGAVAIHDRIEG